ncbi:hypothetical protein AMS68_003863 [Peltaster fructicola]|uniref:Acyltransferase 3 domain-containing protein n=1 Tax=Peltaster fructicola TaxID=286661 RepID=A0A6H0XUI9_9PEZI|nr:hypothetical protein AMS68_003863 [Peltaster fructicola]
MEQENGAILEKGLLSHIQPIRESSTLDGKPAKIRKTAYLDGIRGFAALLVYILHHELWSHGWLKADVKLENNFGYNGQYYLLSFYGLRNLFVGGHFAVSCFFVLSGYVLSAKPLALIMAGDYSGLSENVASALFRRWLRLYLPIIVITLSLIIFYHVTGVIGTVKLEKSFRAELWKWYTEGKNWTFIFTGGGDPWFTYHPHTWSIPVEMKGSIVVYTSAMAFSRCSNKMRLWGEIFLITYFMYIADGAHFAMFMAGQLLCDLDTLEAHNKLPQWLTDLAPYKTRFFTGAFFVALFLGGVPAQSTDMNQFRAQPGWYLLSLLKPQAVFDFKWFYLFWAAILMVSAAGRLPWLRAFFENKYNLYLAKISYGFYLMHGPILWTLGNRMYCAIGYNGEEHSLTMPRWVNAFPYLPRVGPFGFETDFLICQMILFPLTLWAAELCTNFIDDPSIKFTQWLYKQFKGDSGSSRDSRREQK